MQFSLSVGSNEVVQQDAKVGVKHNEEKTKKY